ATPASRAAPRRSRRNPGRAARSLASRCRASRYVGDGAKSVGGLPEQPPPDEASQCSCHGGAWGNLLLLLYFLAERPLSRPIGVPQSRCRVPPSGRDAVEIGSARATNVERRDRRGPSQRQNGADAYMLRQGAGS